MNLSEDILQRLHVALPGVRRWIEDYRERHEDRARAVGSLGFERLSACFPRDLLERSRLVAVSSVPFPPVDRFGLPELARMQEMPFDAITFRNTFYVREGRVTEELCFHELIHVIQWDTLGVDDFLLAYGYGLLQWGYDESPLERMAATLQRDFERDRLPEGVVREVERETDRIWSTILPLIEGRID